MIPGRSENRDAVLRREVNRLERASDRRPTTRSVEDRPFRKSLPEIRIDRAGSRQTASSRRDRRRERRKRNPWMHDRHSAERVTIAGSYHSNTAINVRYAGLTSGV